MTEHETNSTPKRLSILDDEEIEALYARPCFTPADRVHYFSLTKPEHESIQLFLGVQSQLSFLLQLAYFKAKQRFFSFAFGEVEEDVHYVLAHFFPRANRANLTSVSKPTLLKQHAVILNLCQYRLCTLADRQHLAQRAQHAARMSSKPVYIFRELLQSMTEQRRVAPGYTVLQDIVGQALTAEAQRLATIIQRQLTPEGARLLLRVRTQVLNEIGNKPSGSGIRTSGRCGHQPQQRYKLPDTPDFFPLSLWSMTARTCSSPGATSQPPG